MCFYILISKYSRLIFIQNNATEILPSVPSTAETRFFYKVPPEKYWDCKKLIFKKIILPYLTVKNSLPYGRTHNFFRCTSYYYPNVRLFESVLVICGERLPKVYQKICILPRRREKKIWKNLFYVKSNKKEYTKTLKEHQKNIADQWKSYRSVSKKISACEKVTVQNC